MAFFTDTRRATFTALLDTIIPPDPGRGLPGAGELGLAEAMAEVAVLTPGMGEGLDALEAQAGPGGFAALDVASRERVAREVEAAHPSLVGGLLFHLYSAYYERPEVITKLGLEARPPWPKGFEVEAGDLALLDPVRERAPLYREV